MGCCQRRCRRWRRGRRFRSSPCGGRNSGNRSSGLIRTSQRFLLWSWVREGSTRAWWWGAEQDAVVEGGRPAPPEWSDVVGVATPGGLIATGEDAAGVAGDEGGTKLAVEEPVELTHIERDAEATQNHRDDLGITGEQPELLSRHRSGGGFGAADAAAEGVEVDRHVDAGAIAAAGSGVVRVGVCLGDFHQRVGTAHRPRRAAATQPAAGAGTERSARWWLVGLVLLHHGVEQGGELFAFGGGDAALDEGGAHAVGVQVELAVAAGTLLFLLQPAFQQYVGVVGVDDLDQSVADDREFARVESSGVVDHRLLCRGFLSRCEIGRQILQRSEDRGRLPR